MIPSPSNLPPCLDPSSLPGCDETLRTGTRAEASASSCFRAAKRSAGLCRSGACTCSRESSRSESSSVTRPKAKSASATPGSKGLARAATRASSATRARAAVWWPTRPAKAWRKSACSSRKRAAAPKGTRAPSATLREKGTRRRPRPAALRRVRRRARTMRRSRRSASASVTTGRRRANVGKATSVNTFTRRRRRRQSTQSLETARQGRRGSRPARDERSTGWL
mmetsp:Transcript_47895/g.133429  ORF Transcript_47895/g.133429 Transcript_47895/m.133429 type:complete len:224 (-) Transcript_47895:147-818(-)